MIYIKIKYIFENKNKLRWDGMACLLLILIKIKEHSMLKRNKNFIF